MSNAEISDHAQPRGSRSVEVRVSAQLENLAVVRTVVGALATFEDLELGARVDSLGGAQATRTRAVAVSAGVGQVFAFVVEDLDLDAIADLRLAVDEACTRLIKSTTPDATLIVVLDPRQDELVIDVSTPSTSAAEDILAQGSFSWHVLTSLTDDVKVFGDGAELEGSGPVVGISLTTRRVSPAR